MHIMGQSQQLNLGIKSLLESQNPSVCPIFALGTTGWGSFIPCGTDDDDELNLEMTAQSAHKTDGIFWGKLEFRVG